jgi:hypothetical protein
MTRIRRTLIGLVVAGAATMALAPSASAVEANCPGTFAVLHNDRIGNMQLPQGPYVITVLDTTTMGCSEASRLFAEFLEDWDGRLPRPWVADNSTRTFRAGRRSSVGFRVTPDTNPNPPTPPHPPSRRICPGYFQVLHNDRIGSFRIPRGRYRITLLSYAGLTCSQAVRRFQVFLQDFDGVLPRPWHLDPGTGTFTRGHRHIGFRIKPYVSEGSPARRAAAAQADTRRGTHPSGGQSKCPATFRVLHNDRIGALRLKRGNYNVWVRGLSCPRSSQLFGQFLDDPNGVLPRPWRLNVQTGTFTRGRGGRVLFRVKPVNP